MCAGAIYVATGASRVSQMGGLGRRMPVVFVCFMIAGASVIGLPPMAGMWSKFLLVSAAFGSNEWLTAAAMVVSSLLSVVYLMPVAFRALFPSQGDPAPRDFVRPGGTPSVALAAIVITAAACLVLFVFADPLAKFLEPIRTASFVEAAP
jgi:multicomponent Na+:H+ antiporter subunit D